VVARDIDAGAPLTLFGDHLNQEPFWVACECRRTPCMMILPEDWEAKARRFKCVPPYNTPEFLARARKVCHGRTMCSPIVRPAPPFIGLLSGDTHWHGIGHSSSRWWWDRCGNVTAEAKTTSSSTLG
jgi:hypothetical protein